MPLIHAMVDLETTAATNRAGILSIGVALFNKHGVYAEHYRAVEPVSNEELGLAVRLDTIKWWMQQSDEARAVWSTGHNQLGIVGALSELSDFFYRYIDDPSQLRIWGNGATFDNVILRNAYEAAGLPPPWKFWGDFCYRTMKNLAPSVPLERIGIHHNALDDAVSQANHMAAIARHLNIEL